MTETSRGGNAAGRASPARERPLSLSYYTVPELAPPEAVAVAADTGCRNVGLRLLAGQPGGSEMPLMTDAHIRRRTLARMVDTGVTPLDANTARLVTTTNIADFMPFLDAAAELGARHVLTTADDTDHERLQDNLCALCDAAAARGLTIDLEFVPWLSVSSLAGATDLVRRCDHAALGIAVDALHFHRSGSELTELQGLPRPWFRYVQVCDAADAAAPSAREALIHEAVRERLLPGDGVIDLNGLLRVLPPELPLALEIPQATLAASMQAKERVSRAVRATRALLDSLAGG